MSPALRDLLSKLDFTEMEALCLPYLDVLEKLTSLLLVQGVKIGGIYKHWKGKEYLVTDVVRDSEDWDCYKVVYQEVTDARHRAERRVSWFLEDMDDERYTGPRFRLVG